VDRGCGHNRLAGRTQPNRAKEEPRQGPSATMRRPLRGIGGGAIQWGGEATTGMPGPCRSDPAALTTTLEPPGTQKGLATVAHHQTAEHHGCPGTPGWRAPAPLASTRGRKPRTGKRDGLSSGIAAARFQPPPWLPDRGWPLGLRWLARSDDQDPVSSGQADQHASQGPTWRRC